MINVLLLGDILQKFNDRQMYFFCVKFITKLSLYLKLPNHCDTGYQATLGGATNFFNVFILKHIEAPSSFLLKASVSPPDTTKF